MTALNDMNTVMCITSNTFPQGTADQGQLTTVIMQYYIMNIIL